MTILPEMLRAKHVLANNKYFALATIDAQGPWIATLAYTMGPPSCLYFMSQSSSRHGSALSKRAQVAGVIYDSRATVEEVESIQFSGFGEVITDRETIAFVLEMAAKRSGEPLPSQDKIDSAVSNTTELLYRITITEAFVLDQELFAREGKDGRQPFDFKAVFSEVLD